MRRVLPVVLSLVVCLPAAAQTGDRFIVHDYGALSPGHLYEVHRIPLVPDDLTRLSVTGGIPGILEGTIGALDPFGRARVKVDTNALGTALKGVKIWAVCLGLDPQASSGVSHILGPTLLQITQ